MKQRDFSSDPEQMRRELQEVLRDASFAASIGSRESIMSITRLPSDVDIWEHDLAVGDSLYTYSSISRIGVGKSLFAPLAKMLSKRELRAVTSTIKPLNRKASINRRSFIRSMAHPSSLAERENAERIWVDRHTDAVTWPKSRGVDLTPLEIALSQTSPFTVTLSAYQWEAVAVIETVRAAGRVLGSRDADTLANQFMLLILAYGGVKATHVGAHRDFPVKLDRLVDNDSLLRGAFINAALEGTVFDLEPYDRLDELESASGRGLWPLTGPDQMLAITILAAWIRMSRLGVRLSSREALENWETFFDGTSYGYDSDLVGQCWLLDFEENRKVSRRYTFFRNWDGEVAPPWLTARGGSPMIFVGIAAKLLSEAVETLSVLDAIPDEFAFPDDDSEAEIEKFTKAEEAECHPDRNLMELRRLRNRISHSPMGCAYELQLIERY